MSPDKLMITDEANSRNCQPNRMKYIQLRPPSVNFVTTIKTIIWSLNLGPPHPGLIMTGPLVLPYLRDAKRNNFAKL